MPKNRYMVLRLTRLTDLLMPSQFADKTQHKSSSALLYQYNSCPGVSVGAVRENTGSGR